MTVPIKLAHRCLLSIRGLDASNLIQGLVTNDIRLLDGAASIASFILNTKGRIVDDLIISKRDDDLLVECSSNNSEGLKKLLEMYRMRKKVIIEILPDDVMYSSTTGFRDPRIPEFGYRLYGNHNHIEDPETYLNKRLEAGISEGNQEMDGMLPFQVNGDFLNFISLNKGCYIGQELTARTAHTGVIRRRVLPFRCNTPVKEGTEQIMDSKNSKIGKIIRRSSKWGLALLPIDVIQKEQQLTLHESPIVPFVPSWMKLDSKKS